MAPHPKPEATLHTDDVRIEAALAEANIPTLILVLTQFTGDLRWLEPPYLPTAGRGLSDNDDGGLPADVQHEIRKAALEAIVAWRNGRPIAIPDPPRDLLTRMMTVAMGEPIPADYSDMMAAKLASYSAAVELGDEVEQPGSKTTHHPPPGFRALIIGAGMSGLCAAVQLRAMSIPFTIIERSHEVGGTWSANRYPGCGVDTPSHLYSFTFARREWSAYYALRAELQDYFNDIAAKYGLFKHIRFNTEVERTRYEPITQSWLTETRSKDGSQEIFSSNVVISAVGAFGRPKWPDIPGLDTFAGPIAHTAQWPAAIDLANKRVVVIGNGASAMQLVPAIVNETAHLTVFQRSAQWAAPFEKFRRPIPNAQRFLFSSVPMYETWYRMRLGWTFDSRVYQSLHKDPDWPYPERSLNAINDAHRRYFEQYIQTELGDRQDLLDSAVPLYPPYGKRMLLDNGWFRALARDDVTLVTTPIREVSPDGVVTADGCLHEADVLIIATGFDVVRFLATLDIRGLHDKALRDVWDDDDARAYLGTVVPSFPNFFILYGPNTQAGHGGSLMFVIESQMQYICSILDQMFAEGHGAVECRQAVYDDYNSRVDEAHQTMVWTHPSMTTYYRNERGRVVVNSPWRLFDFWKMTRRANLYDYLVEPRSKAPTRIGSEP